MFDFISGSGLTYLPKIFLLILNTLFIKLSEFSKFPLINTYIQLILGIPKLE